MNNKKTQDRISEGYFDELSVETGKRVRERIHWICGCATGESVLDVGCSQGITSILLAREGFDVLGLDSDNEAIDYAINMRANERESTQKHIIFECAEFMSKDFGDRRYDTIIATEILEHLIKPDRFISKFTELLNKSGTLIITVPYGYNDFFDHKKTYVFNTLLGAIEPVYTIINYQFFGKWVGIQCTVNSSAHSIDRQLIIDIEDNYLAVEKKYLNEISVLKEQRTHLKNKLVTTEIENQKLKKVVKTDQELITRSNNELADIMASNTSQINDQYLKIEELNTQIMKKTALYDKIKAELITCLKSEKTIIEQYKAQVKAKNALAYKVSNLEREYNNLRNSKLGRIQVKYWRLKNK